MIFDADTVHLRGQERIMQMERNDGHGGAWKGGGYICANGTWDRPVVYLRKWIDANASSLPWTTPPLVPSVGESLSRESVIERFNSHTRDCKSCMGALRNMRVIRVVCVIVGIVGAFSLVASGVAEIAVGKSVPSLFLVRCAGFTAFAISTGVFWLCQRWITLMLYTNLGHELATSE